MATKNRKKCYQRQGILGNPTGTIANFYIDKYGVFRTIANDNKKKFKPLPQPVIIEPEPTLCELLGLPAWLCSEDSMW